MTDTNIRGTLYKSLDFFMVRTPVLSINEYTELFPENFTNEQDLRKISTDLLITFSKNKLIREAIAVSSPSMLESLPYLYSDDNPRKKKQVLNGFMRFLLRMMSRPTPFGLFSGVTYGMFNEQSEVRMKGLNTYRKRARPDMEWLLKIIEFVEGQSGVIAQLHVRRNQLILQQGDRASIPYKIRYGNVLKGENDSVSVRSTAVFDFIMNETEEPILYSNLLTRVKEQFSDASIDTISSYVWELFVQEFLFTELRPPSTITTPMEYIITKIAPVTGIDALKSKLYEIYTDIEEYNKLSIGEGEEQLLILQGEMKNLMKTQNTLQIDLSLEDRAITLNQNVRAEVEKVAEFLARSFPIELQHMEEYREEFLEKYGPYREIPLLELLDPESGLGAPATYSYPPSSRSVKKSSKFNQKAQLLYQWFISCLNKGQSELILTENMIQQLLEDEPLNESDFIPSIELYFLINARNQYELDQGNYTMTLGPNPGSYGAGKTFGRFIDLFEPSFAANKFMFIDKLERELNPEKLHAEVSFIPSYGRSSNILLTDNFRDYEIAIGTNHTVPKNKQIAVSDLVVGVRNNHFYIKSKSNNKEVIPTAGHMYNHQLTPNIYRFLIEAGMDGYKMWQGLNLDFMFKSPYTPRLKYSKTVLCPATWNIHWKIKKNSEDEMKRFFSDFREEWKVPRYVFITETDNRILVDLDHPLHIEMIHNELIKNGRVILTEHIGGFAEPLIKRDDGFLAAEFVFPLVRVKSNKEADNAKKERDDALRKINTWKIDNKDRVYLPGGRWTYVKLYGLNSRQNEFIGSYWNDFIKECRSKNLISQAYFIRFLDPNVHIRARFELQEQVALSSFLTFFYSWTSELLNKKLITNVTIDTYEPEVERYGGIELMNTVEQLFSADSEIVTDLIEMINVRKIQTDIEIIAVISVIEILNQFGLSLDEIHDLLNRNYDFKEYLDEFRGNRSLITSLLKSSEVSKVGDNAEKQILYQTFIKREGITKYYFTKVLEKEQDKQLMNDKEDIIFSVVHMHLNRLLGTDRSKERKVMILARHSINSLLQYRRKKYEI
ncbi:lantibiotic dehydratase [Paenibacillus sp. FSL H7-0350]|uniref:lantibiotic dehydratase n=1 Tax=Paenibacillus sp. FSL H7-0350 TaxID=2975345 RepID=UPI0031583929